MWGGWVSCLLVVYLGCLRVGVDNDLFDIVALVFARLLVELELDD